MKTLPLKKSLILTAIIVLCATIIFFVIKKSNQNIFTISSVTPTPFIVSVTPVSPNAVATLSLKQAGQNTIDVDINSQNKPVTAVQLALKYDPQVLQTVTLNPGSFFTNPSILSNTIDENKKMIFYVLAIRPDQQPPAGLGKVATIRYSANIGVASTVSLEFLPQTKITSPGIEESILKNTSGIEIPL